jgi:hypothetical protein
MADMKSVGLCFWPKIQGSGQLTPDAVHPSILGEHHYWGYITGIIGVSELSAFLGAR